jgi:hypothetical protein
MGQTDPHRLRQSVGTQNSGSSGVPGGKPEGSLPFHSYLLVLVESGRAMVR